MTQAPDILAGLRRLIGDDAAAITYQTMGQYRGALIGEFNKVNEALAAAPHTAAPAADRAVSELPKGWMIDQARESEPGIVELGSLDGDGEFCGFVTIDTDNYMQPAAAMPIARAIIDALARSTDAPSERGGLWQQLEGLATEENNVVGAHFQEGGDPDNAPEVPEWAQLVIQLATPPAAQGADAPSVPVDEVELIAKHIQENWKFAEREPREIAEDIRTLIRYYRSVK